MSGHGATELLEREAELDALAGLLDRACAGSGETLVIEGEAGVGKTALLEHAHERARAQGMNVLSGRGGELERGFAWSVVRQLLEPSLARLDRKQRSKLLTGSAVLAEPVFGHDPEARGTPEESFSVLHGLYWLTVNMSREAPVLLAVDDLHWADRPSLRFAVHLAPRLEGLPIVLLATMRPLGSEPASDADLLARLSASPRAGHLRPAPLSQQASTEFVRRGLSAKADPEFCLACHEMSGGNPFLLEALFDSVRAEETMPTAEGAAHVRRMTPSTVVRSVLVRLAMLPEGCLALVRAIAVLGARAEFLQARRIAGLDRDQATDALAALTRAGILRGGSRIEFVHPLVRSAVYGDLGPAEGARLHARAAEVQTADDASAEEIAPHLLASLPDGDQARVRRLRAAATQARMRGASELAVDYLARALVEPPDPASRAEVLLELGAAETIQQREEGLSHLREALECASSPEQRAETALRLGDALAANGRLAEAIPLLGHGLTELEGGPSELQAHLQAALIATARWEPTAQSLRHDAVTELTARARAGEQLDPMLHAQLAIETAAAGIDRAAAVDHARRVLNSPPAVGLGASTVPEAALVLTFAGLSDQAWRAIQSCLGTAQRLGWPLGIAASSMCAALTALHLGWISDALASARGATTPGADIQFAPVTAAFLVEALIERNETDAAHDELTQHGLDGELLVTWATTPLLLARGKLRAAIGDHEGAIEDLLATGDRAESWGVRNPAMTPWRSSAASSLAAVGERSKAIELSTQELELARRWGTARAIGVALRALGLAHDGKQGLDLLGQAAGILQDAQAPVEHARALIDLGAMLRRRGTRDQARAQLRHGLDLAQRYGAVRLANRARDELTIAGARPRRDALRGRDALTSSELRVARLAADGKTNNEIAQLLFVTPRTVETHLTNSYAKLGLRSRRELSGALDPQGGREST